MHPDAVLDDMLTQAREHEARADDAGRLARLILTLDLWLNEGGTLPSRWHLATCMARECRVAEAEG